MKKWEYKLTRIHVLQEVNLLGKNGWELVLEYNSMFYFKREIEEKEMDINN